MTTPTIAVLPLFSLDLAGARRYLLSLRSLIDEAIATENPRHVRVALQVLQRQRAIIERLLSPTRERPKDHLELTS